MVSIVLVSHSAGLAEGLRQLIDQMVQGQVPIAAAGGIDDPENPIGTDAFKVQAAIESVYSPDGVVVLMDLGSAFLSAEMALEFLSPDQQEHVYLCPAPFVEGAMSAAVQASAGGDIQLVMSEARAAGSAKEAQFGPGEPEQPAETVAPAASSNEPARELRLTVQNKLGLHARPAARFVRTASRYQAQVQVSKGAKTANAKSINQVATLGVRQGDEILLSASGPDAGEALEAIRALADDNFGDPPETDAPAETTQPIPKPTPATASDGSLSGVPAAPGIAVGPAYQYRASLPEVVAHTVEDPDDEWSRLEGALAAARQELEKLHSGAVKRVGPQEAAIFEAHQSVFKRSADAGSRQDERLFRQAERRSRLAAGHRERGLGIPGPGG